MASCDVIRSIPRQILPPLNANMSCLQTSVCRSGNLCSPNVKKSDINLLGEKLYLDLADSDLVESLARAINILGGGVEKFLSKEVTCIISNKRHRTPESSSPNGSHKSGTHKANSPALSRGKALLLQSKRNGLDDKTKEPIDFAKKWGIKVINVSDFILKYDCLSKTKENLPINPSKCKNSDVKVTNLEEVHIKYEDANARYKPYHKSFVTFPDVMFDDLEDKRTNPKENHRHSLQDAAQNNQPLNSIQSCKFQPRIFNTSNKSTLKHNSLASSVKKTPKCVQNEPKHKTVKRKEVLSKSGYCECCEEFFNDVKQHVLTEKHQQFAARNQNYSSLDETIALLPTLRNLLELTNKNYDHDGATTTMEQKNEEKSSASKQKDFEITEIETKGLPSDKENQKFNQNPLINEEISVGTKDMIKTAVNQGTHLKNPSNTMKSSTVISPPSNMCTSLDISNSISSYNFSVKHHNSQSVPQLCTSLGTAHNSKPASSNECYPTKKSGTPLQEFSNGLVTKPLNFEEQSMCSSNNENQKNSVDSRILKNNDSSTTQTSNIHPWFTGTPDLTLHSIEQKECSAPAVHAVGDFAVSDTQMSWSSFQSENEIHRVCTKVIDLLDAPKSSSNLIDLSNNIIEKSHQSTDLRNNNLYNASEEIPLKEESKSNTNGPHFANNPGTSLNVENLSRLDFSHMFDMEMVGLVDTEVSGFLKKEPDPVEAPVLTSPCVPSVSPPSCMPVLQPVDLPSPCSVASVKKQSSSVSFSWDNTSASVDNMTSFDALHVKQEEEKAKCSDYLHLRPDSRDCSRSSNSFSDTKLHSLDHMQNSSWNAYGSDQLNQPCQLRMPSFNPQHFAVTNTHPNSIPVRFLHHNIAPPHLNNISGPVCANLDSSFSLSPRLQAPNPNNNHLSPGLIKRSISNSPHFPKPRLWMASPGSPQQFADPVSPSSPRLMSPQSFHSNHHRFSGESPFQEVSPKPCVRSPLPNAQHTFFNPLHHMHSINKHCVTRNIQQPCGFPSSPHSQVSFMEQPSPELNLGTGPIATGTHLSRPQPLLHGGLYADKLCESAPARMASSGKSTFPSREYFSAFVPCNSEFRHYPPCNPLETENSGNFIMNSQPCLASCRGDIPSNNPNLYSNSNPSNKNCVTTEHLGDPLSNLVSEIIDICHNHKVPTISHQHPNTISGPVSRNECIGSVDRKDLFVTPADFPNHVADQSSTFNAQEHSQDHELLTSHSCQSPSSQSAKLHQAPVLNSVYSEEYDESTLIECPSISTPTKSPVCKVDNVCISPQSTSLCGNKDNSSFQFTMPLKCIQDAESDSQEQANNQDDICVENLRSPLPTSSGSFTESEISPPRTTWMITHSNPDLLKMTLHQCSASTPKRSEPPHWRIHKSGDCKLVLSAKKSCNSSMKQIIRKGTQEKMNKRRKLVL